MEENNILQEPVYLNYGNNARIDLNKFLNNAANNLNSYLAKLPWSSKKKEKFLAAYQDIMSNGVTGASNSTGTWNIQYNGAIDLDSLSKKDREIYGEAAYYILQQMDAIHEDNINEEEKKKDLPLFDNKYFTELLLGLIGTKEFGGRDWSKQEDWNVLDEADENGIRKTTNRAKVLAQYLKMYSDSLKEGEYNFEGSPFTDLNDFKTRVNNAILALESEDPNDDKDALNKIGLKANDYLSTGLDDIVEVDGKQIKRSDYLKLKDQVLKEQQDLTSNSVVLSLPLSLTTKLRLISSKAIGQNPQALAEKYKNDSGIMLALSELSAKNDLTGQDWSDIVGAYKFYNANGRLLNLTPEELQLFKRFPTYRNVSPSALKKLPGIEGFYFDTRTKLVIKAISNDQPFGGDLLLRKDPNTNPRGKGVELTAADYADLGAMAADLVSIIDPEPLSAGALGVGAAVTRAFNRDWSNNFWSNLGGTVFDVGTGALGAVPGLGDATLGVKTLKNVVKFIGKYAAIPSIAFALLNTPGAKLAYDKIKFGDLSSIKNLTPDDYKALYGFISSVLGARNSMRYNAANRQVLKHSGYEVKSGSKALDYARGSGLLPTKVPTETKIPTIKAKVNGKTKEITIDNKVKEKIEDGIKKAGNDKTARNNAVKEELKNAGKVKESDNVEVEAPTWKDRKYVPLRGNSSKIFGSKASKEVRTGNDDFKDWLENRTWWERNAPWNLGSTKYLESLRSDLGIATSAAKGATSGTTESTPKKPAHISPKDFGLPNNTNLHSYYRNATNANSPLARRAAKHYLDPSDTFKEEFKFSPTESLGIEVKNGKLIVTDKSGSVVSSEKIDASNYSHDVKAKVGKIVSDYRKQLISSKKIHRSFDKEFIKSILNFKLKGTLFKKGGQIRYDKILNYKEFLNKNK